MCVVGKVDNDISNFRIGWKFTCFSRDINCELRLCLIWVIRRGFRKE